MKGYLYDNGYELISREEALPDTSEASAGDVLSLDEDKEPVWSAPSGGGAYLIAEIDTDKEIIVVDENTKYIPLKWNGETLFESKMIPLCGECDGTALSDTLRFPSTFLIYEGCIVQISYGEDIVTMYDQTMEDKTLYVLYQSIM